MDKTMKFPERTQFFDVGGVPVTLDAAGKATAWDRPEPRDFSYDTLVHEGKRVSEEDFRKWVSLQRHVAPEKPQAEFPEGTKFFDVDGIPVTLDGHGKTRVWDKTTDPRRFTLGSVHRDGKPMSEDAFRAWLAKLGTSATS